MDQSDIWTYSHEVLFVFLFCNNRENRRKLSIRRIGNCLTSKSKISYKEIEFYILKVYKKWNSYIKTYSASTGGESTKEMTLKSSEFINATWLTFIFFFIAGARNPQEEVTLRNLPEAEIRPEAGVRILQRAANCSRKIAREELLKS